MAYFCLSKPTDFLMILTINGKQAALKKGSSIEYVSENRIFTDADDWTWPWATSFSKGVPLRCESDLKVDGEPCVFESAAPVS